MKVASFIVLNTERARETGELDYLVTIRLCCEALRALQLILTISQKFNTIWSLLSRKVNE